MKTFATFRVCLLVVAATPTLVPVALTTRAVASDLTVDQLLNNNPYNTAGQGNVYNYDSVYVGKISNGVFGHGNSDIVAATGQVVLGDLPGSTGTYFMGYNGAGEGNHVAILQVPSLVVGNGGQGTFNQGEKTLVLVNTVSLQAAATSPSGTYFLNGGKLRADQVGQNPAGSATSGTFYFNGGVLAPGSGDNATFMQGLTAAYVRYGGATVDTAGLNPTIAQALLHSTDQYGDPFVDGGLTKTGAGTLTLTGANAYNGGTTISAGTLQVGNGGTAGSLSSANGIVNNGTLAFNRSDNVSISIDDGISGTGGLTQLGTGTLTLTGTNTYTGSTTFAAGTLNVGSAGALGTSGTLTFSGGTLQYSAASGGVDFSARFSPAANQAVRLDTNGQSVTLGTGFGGSGTSLTKLGAGTLTVNGANLYTGATNLNAGTVRVNNPGALGNGGAIVFNGGTLQYGDTSHSDAEYNAADYSARFSTAASQAYRVDTNGHNLTFATALTSSNGNLTKLGAGTLTLKGANTYAGITTVSAGTLLLNGASAGRGAINVDGVGNPTLGGTGSTPAAVNVKNGTVNPGNNGGAAGSLANVGNLRVGMLTLANASVFTLDINSATAYDILTSAGNVMLGGSALSVSIAPNLTFAVGQALDLIHLTGGSLTGTFTGIANGGTYTFGDDTFRAVYSATDFQLVAVPEPGVTWLVGAGLLAVGGTGVVKRRRWRAGAAL